MTNPSSHVPKPARLWPPQRIAVTTSEVAATRTHIWTSFTSKQRATKAGLRLKIPFHTGATLP